MGEAARSADERLDEIERILTEKIGRLDECLEMCSDLERQLDDICGEIAVVRGIASQATKVAADVVDADDRTKRELLELRTRSAHAFRTISVVLAELGGAS